MTNYRNSSGKGFGSRGGGYGGQSRSRGQVPLYQAVCDECGKQCEVPFKPTSGRPVYCNACFGNRKEAGGARGGGRGNDVIKANNDELKKQLELLNAKMDQLIKLAETVASVKPLMVKEKAKKAAKTKKST